MSGLILSVVDHGVAADHDARAMEPSPEPETICEYVDHNREHDGPQAAVAGWAGTPWNAAERGGTNR
ncbi:hypothetical protein ACQP00_09980 [Dactylosporangium sp. CS-047395]|uniref:hypothetical protein n=1 Tax=Dactylosporangium sp. CS-047395 TaxID=3239936 RepID=UPI003D8BB238